MVGSLIAAIIGSISFWGSLVAFAKLQEIMPKGLEKTFVANAKLFQAANIVLLLVALGLAIYLGVDAADGGGGASVWWMVGGLLLAAGVMGLFVVFPIGGADMPVVISLLNAMTGLSAAAAGIALDNTALIVAGMIVGASGSILTNLMAKAMNRSIPAIVFGSFGGGDAAAAGGPGGEGGTVKATSPRMPQFRWRTRIRSSSCPVTVWPSRRPSMRSRRWRACSRPRGGWRSSMRFTRSPVVCPVT